jgi:hypothetical protein
VRRIDVNAVAAPDRVSLSWCDEAWVSHPAARTRPPDSFDQLMLAATREDARPALASLPAGIDEIAPRLAAYRAAGAPALLRLFPGQGGHGYPLEDWVLSPIPEFCEAEDLCLVLDFGPVAQGYPWADLVRFAREHPRLPILALCPPLGGPTPARALDAAPNLLLEISCDSATEDGIALPPLVRSHGAYRMFYGSGRAVRDPGVLAALDTEDAEIIFATTPAQLAAGTWGATHL